MRAVLLASMLAAGVAHADDAAPSGPVTEKGKARLAAGVAAYKAKDFAKASQELAAGYAAERYSWFLFLWAQSERQRGDCTSAIPLYERFIGEQPPAEQAQLARDGIAACGGKITTTPVEPLPEIKPEPTPAPPPPEPVRESARPEVRDTPFPHNLALVLMMTGAAFGGSSVVFYVRARGLEKDADVAPLHDDVVRLDVQSDTMLLTSRITAGISVAFIAASVIRFALTDAPPADSDIAVTLTPSGVGIAGRL